MALSSYAWDILNAIKINVQEIPGMPPVRRRKRPVNWNGDPKYLILVSLVSDEKGEETFLGPDGRRTVCIIYRVKIAIIWQDNAQYEEDPPEPLAYRELIRQKFLEPALMPGCPNVHDITIELGDVYDRSAMDQTYDALAVILAISSYEPANGPHPSNQGAA